ncbi:hypothetical protein ACWD6R_34785 [Streptomyces sp. NPDC005151]
MRENAEVLSLKGINYDTGTNYAGSGLNRSGFDRGSISWKDRDRYVEAIPEGSP